jgi:hypothetical protein
MIEAVVNELVWVAMIVFVALYADQAIMYLREKVKGPDGRHED